MTKTPEEIINEDLKRRGPEYVLGLDVPRTWATSVQAFVNQEYSIVMFREQHLVAKIDGGDEPQVLTRNVASIVLPTPILAEFYQNLGPAIEQYLPNKEEADGEGPDAK